MSHFLFTPIKINVLTYGGGVSNVNRFFVSPTSLLPSFLSPKAFVPIPASGASFLTERSHHKYTTYRKMYRINVRHWKLSVQNNKLWIRCAVAYCSHSVSDMTASNIPCSICPTTYPQNLWILFFLLSGITITPRLLRLDTNVELMSSVFYMAWSPLDATRNNSLLR